MGSPLHVDDDDASMTLEDFDDADGIESTPVLCSAATISLMFLILSLLWILLNFPSSSFKDILSYEEFEAMDPLLQVADDGSMMLEQTQELP